MDQLLAERLALELNIDVTQVVREYWEVVLLNRLFEFPAGNDLVFKGGTALRLAFGSPRFSEDLDFSLAVDTMGRVFKDLAASLVKPFAEADITDLAAKRWTYLCEIRINEGYLPQPFRIKLEVSRRPSAGYRSELRLMSSPTTPLQALGRVATLEQLFQDKQGCIKDRVAPKDIFDLWFIAQKMGIRYEPPETKITLRELKRDLGKYLPSDYQKVIGELL
ncbi:MAG: nucleotidyl transferase AbiEii/AbiGii toxin family protein [Candidatus Geothermincolia bacterium]